MDNDSAITSAAQVPVSYLANNPGRFVGESFEMKYRPRHKAPEPNRPRSRPLHTEAHNLTYTSHHHHHISSSSLPSANPQFAHSPPTPSPQNPFIDPPANGPLQSSTGATLVKRTSLEWQIERAAFFSPETATSTTTSRPASPARSHINDDSSEALELDVSDMEAREAGTAPLTGRQHPQSEFGSLPCGNSLIRKSKSWIDEGVGFVDGAVNAFAAKIGRWTDDDGGDDALLLPVARQGRGTGVSVG
ncbi:hypothetical protein G6011_03312 [Alternaria panax]|uniref:Uncharacterized protein n=1 Tax=Alternaria panax TaxID=48097 RepID=A0AAD4IEV0_9PLEO|nr:hypothetical protein G6011_03312 [Alternaria panax]